MGEVVELINTADMRYKSEKREFIIDALALPVSITESNRATYYICAYYKAASLGAKAFFYTDARESSLLDKNSNRGALYYMFLLCGTDKTEQLGEYTRKVEGFTTEKMQQHVFKKLKFSQSAKYEISDADAKKSKAFPAALADFKENGITRTQLTLIKGYEGVYKRNLDIYANTAIGVGAVTAFDVDAKQIKASKYLGVTLSTENSPAIAIAITNASGDVAYIAQTNSVNGESEYFFDLTGWVDNVSESDKLYVSICLLSDDETSKVTISDMKLYGSSGLEYMAVIIIAVVAVVAVGLIAAVVGLALKRKKKRQQD